jgi:CRP-like cAMP-binding protein
MSEDYVVLKLQAFEPLPEPCIDALRRIATNRPRSIKARHDVISEGDPPREVYLITNGWAFRYKILEDGRRQIMSFFVPGDICDVNVYILKQMDHSICAVTALDVARISADEMQQLGDDNPRILRALWWDTLVSASIQREWTVSLGQRDAVESLAHLLCELFLRLRVVGLTDGNSCPFPLTQQHLADALGLTTTHLGRVLRVLRESDLVDLGGKRLTIRNLARLKELGCFNPNYLHQGD